MSELNPFELLSVIIQQACNQNGLAIDQWVKGVGRVDELSRSEDESVRLRLAWIIAENGFQAFGFESETGGDTFNDFWKNGFVLTESAVLGQPVRFTRKNIPVIAFPERLNYLANCPTQDIQAACLTMRAISLASFADDGASDQIRHWLLGED